MVLSCDWLLIQTPCCDHPYCLVLPVTCHPATVLKSSSTLPSHKHAQPDIVVLQQRLQSCSFVSLSFCCVTGGVPDGGEIPALEAPNDVQAQQQEENGTTTVLQAEALPKCSVCLATQHMQPAA